MAAAWIFEHAIFNSVELVASPDDRVAQQRARWRREVARAVTDGGDREHRGCGHERRPVVRRCTGDDAVVIRGEALCLGEALLAASRAADPVRVLRRPAIERLRHRFGLHRHLVHGAPREIDEPLGMTVGEPRIATVTLVSSIRRHGRIAATHLVGERCV